MKLKRITKKYFFPISLACNVTFQRQLNKPYIGPVPLCIYVSRGEEILCPKDLIYPCSSSLQSYKYLLVDI